MKASWVQFTQHAGPQATLVGTAPLDLVEASPQDFFWGRGVDGTGANHLGVLLMRVRDGLLRGNVSAETELPLHTIASVRPHGLVSAVAK